MRSSQRCGPSYWPHLLHRPSTLGGALRFICRASVLKLIFELLHEAQHRPGARFAEGANRPALDVLRDVQQVIGVLFASVTVREAMQRFRHPERTLPARRALAATLVRVELGYVGQRLDDVGRVVYHDNGPRTAHAAGL